MDRKDIIERWRPGHLKITRAFAIGIKLSLLLSAFLFVASFAIQTVLNLPSGLTTWTRVIISFLVAIDTAFAAWSYDRGETIVTGFFHLHLPSRTKGTGNRVSFEAKRRLAKWIYMRNQKIVAL